jgi:hypothetical protein
MLQPQKKKLNPAQKTRALTSKTKSKGKAPANYDVDWDAVRSVNDNTTVQAAKMFDPTGLTSWPDVYYAIDDYNKGKGSGWNIALNVLGALPVLGKLGKGAGMLAKSQKLTKVTNKVSKINRIVDKVEKVVPNAAKMIGNTSDAIANASRAGRANPVAVATKVVGKVAKGVEKADTATRKVTGKILDKIPGAQGDIGNLVNAVSSTLNIANTASDVKAVVDASNKNSKPEIKETVKFKTVYYNTDPKRGEVEKPGTETNVQYVPVSNSIQLERWKEQKLAYGTNSQGIMKNKMNPRKKYANGSSAKGMNTNNYIISPAEALNDYNIMMAKVEAKAMSNPWLPIVAAVGGAAQSFVGNASNYVKKPTSFTTSGEGLNLIDTASQSPIGDRYKKAMGTDNIQTDVEVEGGEMYETPQGEVGEFQGPSHAEGGIPLEVVDTPVDNPNKGQVQEETKVYSKDLMLQGKSLAERKATRERQTANLEKIASQPLIDQAVKNATKRKMMAIQKEEAGDLAFQEKVNNIQQMADTMVAAYGTSMAGIQSNPIGDSMEYGYGSGMTGVQKYYTGTDDTGIDPPWMLPSSSLKDDPNYVEPMTLQQIQTIIGSNPDGTWGRRDRRKARNFIKDKNQSAFPSWARGGEGITKNQSDMEQALADESFQKQFRRVYLGEPYSQEELDAQAEEDAAFYIPGEQIGVAKKENPPGTVFSRTLKNIFTGNKDKDKENKSEGDESEDNPTAMGNMMRSLPGMGDMTKLVGNYLGMTSGIKTANEQRASDVTKTNVYRNAGEESQRLLDNAKKGIEINKAQAIVKANTNTRTGKKGAGNAARGINQKRGMDWLYDTALNQQIADITAGAAEKMSAIDIQKSGVAMNADQLKGQGEWQATLANDADKDAYYTALGLGRKDFATGLQQSGKDINAMKENKIIENLMKNYGKWVGASNTGVLMNKAGITQDPKTKQYKDASGKILTEEEVQAALLKVTV